MLGDATITAACCQKNCRNAAPRGPACIDRSSILLAGIRGQASLGIKLGRAVAGDGSEKNGQKFQKTKAPDRCFFTNPPPLHQEWQHLGWSARIVGVSLSLFLPLRSMLHYWLSWRKDRARTDKRAFFEPSDSHFSTTTFFLIVSLKWAGLRLLRGDARI